MKWKHRKNNTMNVILIICGVFLLLFTAAMVAVFLRTGTEMSTLEGCVFGAIAGEAGIMGWIKTAKVRRQERECEQEDKDNASMDNE